MDYILLNSLSNNKFLDWSRWKAFADNKIKTTEKTKISYGKGRKRVKRRKCWLPAFSPFPTMFSNGFFYKVVKSRDGVVKSYPITTQCHISTH